MNAADTLAAAGLRNSDTLTPPKERRTVLNQEDFMTLLSTQLRFQDPGKPMEANEMVAQMAQLSMVTGITELKTQLADLSQSLTSSRASQAAQLGGREVLLPGTAAWSTAAMRRPASTACTPIRAPACRCRRWPRAASTACCWAATGRACS